MLGRGVIDVQLRCICVVLLYVCGNDDINGVIKGCWFKRFVTVLMCGVGVYGQLLSVAMHMWFIAVHI